MKIPLHKLSIAVLLLATSNVLVAQRVKKVETYYDAITRTRVHEVYTTLTTPPYPVHGVYKEFDQGGNLMNEISFQNGKKNGPHKVYINGGMSSIYGRENVGKLLSVTNFSNDQLDGVDQMFTYTNGKQQPVIKKTWVKGKQIKEEAWLENGKLIRSITSNGPCIEYYEDGKKQREYSKKNEEYEGPYFSWYPNGQLEVSTTYKNGKEEGKHIEYFSSGKIKLEATYVNGKMSGSVMLYFDNGKERKKINYDPTTFNLIEEREYSSTGKLKFERTRIHDTQYKSIIYDSVSGTKQLEQEELWDSKSNSNSRHGRVIKYHSNGKIFADGIFSNGQPNGSYKEYDDSGELIRSGEYENGEETGEWLIYYDAEFNKVTNKNEASFFRKINFTSVKGPWPTTDFFITGEKQFEGMLAKVSPDVTAGKCIFYNKNGTISQEENLDNAGNLKSMKVYHENGKLDKEAVAVNTPYGPGEEWIEYYSDGKIKAKGNTAEVGKVGVWIYYDENGNSTQVNER